MCTGNGGSATNSAGESLNASWKRMHGLHNNLNGVADAISETLKVQVVKFEKVYVFLYDSMIIVGYDWRANTGCA